MGNRAEADRIYDAGVLSLIIVDLLQDLKNAGLEVGGKSMSEGNAFSLLTAVLDEGGVFNPFLVILLEQELHHVGQQLRITMVHALQLVQGQVVSMARLVEQMAAH